MSNKHQELLGVPKHANQHRLSRLTMEVHTDELRIMASAVESYTDELIAALEAAEKRIAELEAHPYLPQPLNIKDEYQNYEYVSGWNDCRNAANVREHTAAIRDVIAERYRQQSVEGWTPEHDDQYMHCEMAVAAACYIMADDDPRAGVPELWPWPEEWWKPTTIRRDLVKAGALILAEIERIDRAAGIGKGE
ncbi:ead/Ea22-like family protein [Citrobacter amalonaticus]